MCNVLKMNVPTIEMYMEIDQRIYLELCYVHLMTMGFIIYLSASLFFCVQMLVINDVLYYFG